MTLNSARAAVAAADAAASGNSWAAAELEDGSKFGLSAVARNKSEAVGQLSDPSP